MRIRHIAIAQRDRSDAGDGPAPGTSRIHVGVRREQAGEAARNGHESGVGQSTFVDSHRREGAGRQGHRAGPSKAARRIRCSGSASRRIRCPSERSFSSMATGPRMVPTRRTAGTSRSPMEERSSSVDRRRAHRRISPFTGFAMTEHKIRAGRSCRPGRPGYRFIELQRSGRSGSRTPGRTCRGQPTARSI